MLTVLPHLKYLVGEKQRDIGPPPPSECPVYEKVENPKAGEIFFVILVAVTMVILTVAESLGVVRLLTFNGMLELEGMNLSEVRLVKHTENKGEGGQSPYSLWRSDMDAFRVYNSIQIEKRFGKAKFAAIFLGTHKDETVFACIYRILGSRQIRPNTICPVQNAVPTNPKAIYYDLVESEILADMSGRISIDWGGGARAWSQRADRQQKSVIEIRTQFKEPDFPGWRKFSCSVSDLYRISDSWKELLRNTSGIYLLVHQPSGKQYVGSAYGLDGFWGRWQSYASNGHGGNIELKKLRSKDYVVSVLETASSTLSSEEVIRLESDWKNKLGTRTIGLNAN